MKNLVVAVLLVVSSFAAEMGSAQEVGSPVSLEQLEQLEQELLGADPMALPICAFTICERACRNVYLNCLANGTDPATCDLNFSNCLDGCVPLADFCNQ